MTSELRTELVDTRVAGIDAAFIQIGHGRDGKDAAATVQTNPVDLLALLVRNPDLDTALDDLQKSVHLIIEAGERTGADDRQMRLLTEAMHGSMTGSKLPTPRSFPRWVGLGARLRKLGANE